METPTKEDRIKAGLYLINTWTENVEWLKNRLKMQEAGQVKGDERVYNNVDIEMEQEKIDRATEVIKELKA